VPVKVLPAGRRWSLLALLILVSGALAGCFSSKNSNERCDDVSEYQSSRSVPGVVVPDGLSAPSHSSVFVVPPAGAEAAGGDLSGDSAAVQPGAACLPRPPDFFRKDPAPAAK
jgi:uncharacterized lipoprotein